MLRKTRKKLLGLLLAGSMLLSSAVPTMATTPNELHDGTPAQEESLIPQETPEQTDPTVTPESSDVSGDLEETPIPERQEAGPFSGTKEEVTLVAAKEKLTYGETTTITLSGVNPEEITQIEWTVDNAEVASVSATSSTATSATLTAVKAGAVQVTATVTTTEATDNVYSFESNQIKVIETPTLTYRAHVQKIGWQNPVSNGEMAGTEGQALRMEALEINLSGVKDLGIRYSAHVQKIGWQDYVSNGKMAGTEGQALRVEAFKLELTGDKASDYDIFYRTHVQTLGWLGWAKNGAPCGSQGFSYRMEAMEIMILPAGETPEGYDESKSAFSISRYIEQRPHVQKKGWMSPTRTSQGILGTTGLGLNMEAFTLKAVNFDDLGIEYSAHVQKIGWQDWVSDGEVSGTTGKSLRVEAVRIRLTGEDANQYDIYYRAHIANVGWLDWAKNGEDAGSAGLAYGLQAIEIRIVAKGEAAPGSTTMAFMKTPSISYQAHVQTNGWMAGVSDSAIAGTTGQGLRLEAFKVLSVNDVPNLSVRYRAMVNGSGWQDFVSVNNIAGTEGQGKSIGAIRMELTGSQSSRYNIWYRVHSQKVGWLGWAKNGENAGCSSTVNYEAQAIQVVILAKGKPAPGSTVNAYVNFKEGWVYKNGYRVYQDARGNILNDVTSKFNPSQKYITVDRKKGITTIYGYNSATGKYDTPIKAMYCSVGNPISLTPAGTHSMGWQVLKKEMNASDGSYRCWASYVSQIKGAVYFHGVASDNPELTRISAGAFNALGTPQSHGCVRLAAVDAKWIYYHVKGQGATKVAVVDNVASPLTPTRYAWKGGLLGPDPTYNYPV